MESGLEGRNNDSNYWHRTRSCLVSMESGLEGRNNSAAQPPRSRSAGSLNGVRPRRPEQCDSLDVALARYLGVSMESGLEGRNNASTRIYGAALILKSQWSPA